MHFTQLWARPGTPQPAWAQALVALCTPDFAATLASVDPAKVPASRALGAAAPTTSGSAQTVRVTTDTGAVIVGLSQLDGAWKVVSISPASASSDDQHAGASLKATYTPLPRP